MKRTISIVLAMAMVLSLCACSGTRSTPTGGGSSEKTQTQAGGAEEKQEAAEPAAEAAEPAAEAAEPAAEAAEPAAEAAAAPADANGDYTRTYKTFGITVHYPAYFVNTKGTFYSREGAELEPGINAMSYYYAAVPKDVYTAWMNSETSSEEESREMRSRMTEVLYVFSIDKGRGAAEIVSVFPDLGLNEEQFTKIGQADEVTYYIFDSPELLYHLSSDLEPEYLQEYQTLHDDLIEALKNAEFFPAIIPGAHLIGQTFKFETTDVDGNPVKSEEIFAQNKITMVNIWATWCGNCVGELTELAEMNRRLADKNVAVIGICTDADTRPDECKALIAEHEVDYLNLMPVDNLDEMLEIPGLPTSYFVDSQGKIMSAPYIGAPREMSAYEKVIDSLLEGEEVEVERGTPVSANSEGVYHVIVTDSDGDFVPGVRVQFCSDSMCRMGKTDENGVATFKADEGEIYTVHIMKFPEGYVPNTEEYKTADTYCDVCIVLQKQ